MVEKRLCECGCGNPTPLARWHTRDGIKPGEPLRFFGRHGGKLGGPRPTPFDEWWHEEDRGYTTPCWIWGGSRVNGYGIFARTNYRTPAHRHAWIRKNGPVPDGLDLDHLCRIRACVNPDHLEPVTRAVNCRRSPRTKLSMEQAREIRSLAASGLSRSKIAARFGVTKGMINHVVHNRAWREGEERTAHVSKPPSIG